MQTPKRQISRIAVIAGLGLLAQAGTANALPNFASQTGQPCVACHTGGFGPELTPFGRAFKIGGYTQEGGDGAAAKIPLSAMVLGSFNHTASAYPDTTQPAYFGRNNNFAVDQVSLFLAGRITDWAGGFVQGTYSGISRTYHLDLVDIRPFTKAFDISGSELRAGLALSNTPTVTDPYNSTFAWGFPYVFSGIAPQPAGLPLLAGGFGTNSLGLTGYLWYDRRVYFELGGYTTMSPALMSRFGTEYGPGASRGLSPYARVAYEWNWNGQSAHVGALFMSATVNPAIGALTADGSFGQDRYIDFGIDAGYQFLGDGTHTASVSGIYVHENRTLNATTAMATGSSAGASTNIDHARIKASYWYQNTYGLTLGWQGTWGSGAQAVFTTGEPITNSASGKPDTNAFLIEAAWVPFGKQDSWAAPFANMKLGLQYIAYTKFNGGITNYDGFGRNASDNNTLYTYMWMTF